MFNIVKKRTNVRSTKQQIKSLLEYMSCNKGFANNVYQHHEEEWKALQLELNKLGPKKTIDQWKTTWKDLKKKSRDERYKVEKANAENDGPPQELSEQSKLIFSITEAKFEQADIDKAAERANTLRYEDESKVDLETNEHQTDDELELECNISVDSNEMTDHILSHDSTLDNTMYSKKSTKRRKTEDIKSRFADSSVNDNTVDMDEVCMLFGKLVAKKLNRLPEERRDAMMVKINQMFIDERFENIPPYPPRPESESNRSEIEKHFIVSSFD